MTMLPETFPPELAEEQAVSIASPPFDASALPQSPAVQAVLVAAVEAPKPQPAEPHLNVQTAVLTLVGKTIEGTRARYALAHSAAQEAAAAADASFGAAQAGAAVLQAKTIEAIQAGVGAQFDLVTSLAGARTLSDLLTVQTEFARRQFDAQTTHAKQLVELARQVAVEAAAPLQAHVAKTFKM